jgi:methionyl-tRNA formyltransferase
MRIIIVTQDERLYLPASFARVCAAYPGDVVAIVSAPALSTHGDPITGLWRHVRLFGVGGTAILTSRVALAWLRSKRGQPGREGPFYSIEQVARAFDVPYHEVDQLKGAGFSALLDRYAPELLVSISCPQIIGKAIRDRLPMGSINVHGAPLPRYRGLMPAFWVLRNGETSTAVTVHELAAKLDDGEILAQREVLILPDDTWDSLVTRTKEVGAELLVDTIARIADGSITRRPNPEAEATYFSFPTAADRRAFLGAGRRFFG